MMEMDERPRRAYRRTLQSVSAVGFVLVSASFGLYLLGTIGSMVNPSLVAESWHLGAEDFARTTHWPSGWTFVRALDRADGLAMGALVLVSLGVPLAFTCLSLAFARDRRWTYALLSALQAVILVAAAAGILR